MERILNCTLSLGSISPDTPLFCGMQGEHRATALVMKPDVALLAEIESKTAAGEKVFCRTDIHTLTGECIKGEERDISLISEPFWLTSQMTSSGLDAIAVFHLAVKDGGIETEIYKAQFPLCFEPSPLFCENLQSNREAAVSIKEQTDEAVRLIDGRLSRAEELIDIKATALSKRLTEAANVISRAEKLVEYAEESKELLSSDTEFVFVGGDAAHSVSAEFTVEDSFIPDSTNPVQSKAIAEAITKIKSNVNAEFSNVNVELSNVNAELSSVNAELSNVNAELSNVEKKTNKVEAIYDDATETQYPNVKAVKEYVDRAVDYIEKQGTNGIWTYEKWSSGKAVCYATVNETLNLDDKYTGEIYHTVANATFPSNLFIDPPKVWLEILSAGGLFVKSVSSITKDDIGYYIGEFTTSPANRTLDIMIEAKGRWK